MDYSIFYFIIQYFLLLCIITHLVLKDVVAWSTSQNWSEETCAGDSLCTCPKFN